MKASVNKASSRMQCREQAVVKVGLAFPTKCSFSGVTMINSLVKSTDKSQGSGLNVPYIHGLGRGAKESMAEQQVAHAFNTESLLFSVWYFQVGLEKESSHGEQHSGEQLIAYTIQAWTIANGCRAMPQNALQQLFSTSQCFAGPGKAGKRQLAAESMQSTSQPA